MRADSVVTPRSGASKALPRLRRTARIFLFNERGEILLIRFVAELQGEPFIFWVTPGGEVEPGEDERTAAERELFEELGLRVALAGPVHQAGGGEYVHLGERVRNYDVFFAARCDADAPKLTGVTADEIALMREMRWWCVDELSTTQERIYPERLCDLLPGAVAVLDPAK